MTQAEIAAEKKIIAANIIVKARLLYPPKRIQRAGCGACIQMKFRKVVTTGEKDEGERHGAFHLLGSCCLVVP